MAGSPYPPAAENIMNAAYFLATREGSLRERLVEAFEFIRVLRPHELPEDDLGGRVLKLKEQVGLRGEDCGSRKIVEAAIDKLGNSEARRLGRELISLAISFGRKYSGDRWSR